MGDKKLRIGILAGGRSNERAVSLKSAEQVAKNLSKEKYDIRMIEMPVDAVFPSVGKLRDIDLAFIAMHGKYAEDGRVQGFLDMLDIPYTGSGVLASAIGMNKVKTRELVGLHNVPSPRSFELYEMPADMKLVADRIEREVGFPCVIKPNESGSSVGVSLVSVANEIESALSKALAEDDSALVEQYIKGREVTCGVMGNTNQMELKAMPVIEIVSQAPFFDYQAKYESKETQEICPADLTPELTTRVQDLAKRAHQALECRGLTRSDLMIAEDGTPYFLEINTIPGMTEASLCPKEAQVMGISFSEFLDMLVQLALLE